MTQDEIIEMAGFAGITIDNFGFQGSFIEEFVAFANLVAAKATEEANARANTSWTFMCKKMVENERKACERAIEELLPDADRGDCASAIRKRGEA